VSMHHVPSWYFDSLPREGRGELFITNQKLKDKVDGDGRFRLFGGETLVFELPESVRRHLAETRDRLYDAAGDMLARQKLSADSFHMTLHSLWDMGEEIPYANAPYTATEVREVLAGIRRDFPDRIMMRAICPLNMVNTSVVMGLAAASEPDSWALAELSRRMSALYPRPYSLTPHVTLAYYRPGEYPEEVWKKLKSVFTVEGFSFPINTQELYFKRFSDMANYSIVY